MPNTQLTEPAEVLRQQLHESTHRAESLRRVIESISGELALAPLIERILESAVELLAAQHGSIGLVAETSAGPIVRVAAIVNMPREELGAEHAAGVGLAPGACCATSGRFRSSDIAIWSQSARRRWQNTR